jgi:hypothetical protein
VDNANGVITAVETTSGSIAENKKLMDLVTQHEQNTRCEVKTKVADHKYGTAENFVACHQKGIVTHMWDAKAKAGQVEGIFPDSHLNIRPKATSMSAPVGERLRRRRYIKRPHAWEYSADKPA